MIAMPLRSPASPVVPVPNACGITLGGTFPASGRLGGIFGRGGLVLLTLPVLGQQGVKMIFTEAGELARIDLPDGYALLEPLIHGLQEGVR